MRTASRIGAMAREHPIDCSMTMRPAMLSAEILGAGWLSVESAWALARMSMTPSNPGPLTAPLASWTHSNPNQSFPPGYIGNNAVGGVFYTGASYPQAYRGAYFYGDYGAGWISVLKVDGDNQYVNSFGFASGINWLVDVSRRSGAHRLRIR